MHAKNRHNQGKINWNCVMTQIPCSTHFNFSIYVLHNSSCILRWMSINLHLGRAQPFYMSAWSKAEQLPNVRWQLSSRSFGLVGLWNRVFVVGAYLVVTGLDLLCLVPRFGAFQWKLEKSITTLGKSMNTMEKPAAKTMEKSMNSANGTF